MNTKDFGKLGATYYKTIYSDPPWLERGAGKIKRGADRHYKLMKTADIAELPVAALRHPDGCHLYLWVTNNYLEDGLAVMKAWGFEYVTTITWVKGSILSRVTDALGSYIKLALERLGLGQYFRGRTEHCLFGVYKALPYKTRPDGKRAQGETVIFAPRGKHSSKPEEMRKMAELVSHEPRVELFARTASPGWDTWGDEAVE